INPSSKNKSDKRKLVNSDTRKPQPYNNSIMLRFLSPCGSLKSICPTNASISFRLKTSGKLLAFFGLSIKSIGLSLRNSEKCKKLKKPRKLAKHLFNVLVLTDLLRWYKKSWMVEVVIFSGFSFDEFSSNHTLSNSKSF